MSNEIKDLIANDKNLRARWVAFFENCEKAAASKGIEVTADDVLSLRNARLYVLTGDSDFASAWEDEARETLPAFSAAAKTVELRDALASDKASEEQQKDFDKMSRHERMRLGREIDKLPPRKGSQEDKKPLTGADRDKAIRLLDTIKSPALRLQKARELGLS